MFEMEVCTALNAAYTVDTVVMVYTVDMVNSVDTFYTVYMIYTVDTADILYAVFPFKLLYIDVYALFTKSVKNCTLMFKTKVCVCIYFARQIKSI